MKGRSTVHQHGVTLNHVLQDVPNDGVFSIDDFLCTLNGLNDSALDEFADDERFVQLCRHILGNTHLVHLQLGTNDDYRTSRVVHTFTQQVLTETTLFTFQAVAKRLVRTVALSLNGVALTRVVEQRIHSLLQHTFLVAQDDFGCLNFDKSFKTVVTDDYAAIQVVQVRSCETATIEGHQRTQLGRCNGNHLQNHPFGFVNIFRCTEGLDDVQALQCFGFTLLRSLGVGFVAQLERLSIEVYVFQQVVDSLTTHLCDELVGIIIGQHCVLLGKLVENVKICFLVQQIQFAYAELLCRTGLNNHIALVVDDALELLGGDVQQVSDLRRKRAEVPNVNYGHNQRNVTHTLTAYFLFGNFHTATVADNTFIANAFVLTAVALIVLYGTEDALAEQTVAFRFICTVVYRFGFQHLAARILENLLGRCKTNRDAVETYACLIISINSHNLLFICLVQLINTVCYCSLTLRARPFSS